MWSDTCPPGPDPRESEARGQLSSQQAALVPSARRLSRGPCQFQGAHRRSHQPALPAALALEKAERRAGSATASPLAAPPGWRRAKTFSISRAETCSGKGVWPRLAHVPRERVCQWGRDKALPWYLQHPVCSTSSGGGGEAAGRGGPSSRSTKPSTSTGPQGVQKPC